MLNPKGKVLSQNKKELLSLENSEEIEISAKREINYQNQNTDVCIYYEFENTIETGKYQVEIYADNNKIGITSFALK